MSNPKKSIAERLNAANVVIMNSLNDAEIGALVAEFGYPPEVLHAGRALYESALAAVNAARAAAGAQESASAALFEVQKEARGAYQDLAKTARAVFRGDRSTLTALGLTGNMPLSTAGFLAAARTLFENAGRQEGLAAYGYGAEKLVRESAKIDAFEAADLKQEAAKGSAQQATREQDAALAALDAWRAQYVKIARVALRGKPQLLEKLGVIARSPRSGL